MNEIQKAKIAMEVARWGQEVCILGQDAGGTIWVQLEAKGPVYGIDRMGDWSRARFYEAKRLQKVGA